MKDTLSTTRAASELASVYDGTCFSYVGALALVEYLEELEEDCGFEIEFDPIAINCDYSEYPSLVDWAEDYFSNWHEEFGIEYVDSMGKKHTQSVTDEDGHYHYEVLNAIMEYIRDNGVLIEFDGGIIVSSF